MAVTQEEAEARKAFGLALAHVRQARGWSQAKLRDEIVARDIKVSVGGIGMWETGKNDPTTPQLRAIEELLGAPGLGLILGVDTGAMARLSAEVAELRGRLALVEGATITPVGVEDAIKAAPDLDEPRRDFLLDMARRELAAQERDRARTASTEPSRGRRTKRKDPR